MFSFFTCFRIIIVTLLIFSLLIIQSRFLSNSVTGFLCYFLVSLASKLLEHLLFSPRIKVYLQQWELNCRRSPIQLNIIVSLFFTLRLTASCSYYQRSEVSWCRVDCWKFNVCSWRRSWTSHGKRWFGCFCGEFWSSRFDWQAFSCKTTAARFDLPLHVRQILLARLWADSHIREKTWLLQSIGNNNWFWDNVRNKEGPHIKEIGSRFGESTWHCSFVTPPEDEFSIHGECFTSKTPKKAGKNEPDACAPALKIFLRQGTSLKTALWSEFLTPKFDWFLKLTFLKI